MENMLESKSELIKRVFILSYGVNIDDGPAKMLVKHQTIHTSQEKAFECALNQIKSQYLELSQQYKGYEEEIPLFKEEYKRLCSLTNLEQLDNFMRKNEFTDFYYPNHELGNCVYSFALEELTLNKVPDELYSNLEIESQLLSNLDESK